MKQKMRKFIFKRSSSERFVRDWRISFRSANKRRADGVLAFSDGLRVHSSLGINRGAGVFLVSLLLATLQLENRDCSTALYLKPPDNKKVCKQ